MRYFTTRFAAKSAPVRYLQRPSMTKHSTYGFVVWFLGLVGFMALSPRTVRAQQDPVWTLYMYNQALNNPAFAGSAGGTQVTFAGRNQWVGIEGAPRTFSLVGHTPSKLLHGGVGLAIMGDQLGPFRSTDVRLMYAYRLKLNARETRESRTPYLSIGVTGGLLQKSLDGTAFRPPDNPNDPALINQVVDQSLLDLGAGVALFGPARQYYLAVGAGHLLEPKLTNFTNQLDSLSPQSVVERSVTLTGGYRFYLRTTRGAVLEPSFFLRSTGPITQVDVNLNLEVSPVVLGLSYRLNDAAAAILGLQASDRLFVGYSYDYTLSQLGAASGGSHELLISYTLPPKLRRIIPQFNVRNKASRPSGGN